MNSYGLPKRRFAGRLGSLRWLHLLWLLVVLLFLGMLLRAELRRIEGELDRSGEVARQQVFDALRNNEAVLEGFAAMLDTLGEQDWDAATHYAQRMLRRYPHVYMLEVAQKVERARLPGFEQAQRARYPGYAVRTFSYLSDRQWRPVPDKPVYYPLVFAAPMSPHARQVLGLDIASVPFLDQGLKRCTKGSPFATSPPFRLVEDGLAYILLRHAHGDARVLLVVRTDALLSEHARRMGRDVGYRLWQRDFTADDPRGLLWQRPGVSRYAIGWLSPMRITYGVECAGQSFLLRVDKQVSLADFDWLSLGGVLAMAGLGSLMLLLYGRARLRQETHQRRYTDDLLHQAQHDSLTGLPNRALLMDRLGLAIARAKRNHHRFAVLFMDVDRFKQVNDNHGHAMGDQLLQTIGQTLQHGVRSQDTVSRVSGDEFVVILDPVGQREHAQAIAEKLIDAVHAATRESFPSLSVAMSSGLAIYPTDADSVSGLMQRADSEMYANKQSRAP